MIMDLSLPIKLGGVCQVQYFQKQPVETWNLVVE